MAGARRTDPELWDKVKRRITAGEKGGHAGQWSARKAQLAVSEYKQAGGGFVGAKTADNPLTQWTREDWGTKSGKNSGETGERYLPRRVRDGLTDDDYARSTAKKRADSRRGQQYSAQPSDVAKKAARTRDAGPTLRELCHSATAKGIAGRSRMNKSDLMAALS
jgi:hypothetical protein